MRFPRLTAAVLALAAFALIAAAWGDSSSGITSASARTKGIAAPVASTQATPSATGTTVSLGSAAGVGKVLVNAKGMTLYYFSKDVKGSGVSKCTGACAQAWPPLITKGKPTAKNGVKSSMLGTMKRSNGMTQVTYAGRPLYTFIEDKKPGDDTGTGIKAFGGSFFPLHSNGKKAGD
jgi:predicted lipoprotein with Yx(FWY)xxD motif